MKKPLEKDVLRQCLDWLALMRVTAWRNNSGGARLAGHGGRGQFVRFGAPGSSDIIGVLPGSGRILCIECKRVGGKTTEAQEAFLQRVRDAGGLALVITSVEQLIEQVSPLLAARE